MIIMIKQIIMNLKIRFHKIISPFPPLPLPLNPLSPLGVGEGRKGRGLRDRGNCNQQYKSFYLFPLVNNYKVRNPVTLNVGNSSSETYNINLKFMPIFTLFNKYKVPKWLKYFIFTIINVIIFYFSIKGLSISNSILSITNFILE
uniref:Uncharacterized protein n=1 Tax=Hypsizygus marmoreus TaxID=39966 RepID=A0A4P8D2R6_HYPMA|nr:hypothetical protein [Hypsizygus marmoreus]